MLRVAIWGTAGTYYENAKILYLYECIGEIRIDCFVNNDCLQKTKFNKRDLLPSSMFFKEYEANIDCIIIASAYYNEIVSQIEHYGSREKIVPIDLLQLPFFDFASYCRIKNDKCSIVSENCIGGILSHQLGLKFYSPFVNMSIKSEDYFRLVNKIDYFMDKSPQMELSSQYPYAKLKCWKDRPEGAEAFLWYDDMMLRGTHYSNKKSFFEVFEKRRERFNHGNRLIMKILYDEDDVEKFRNINERKIGFYFKEKCDKEIIYIPLEKDMSKYDYRYDALILEMFLSKTIHRYVDFFSIL